MAKKKGFVYKKRTPESVRRRAEQSSGSYDRILKDNLETLSVKEGSYQLRILPPTWADAEHYGLEIFVHYDVGPDNGQYLCPEKHKNAFCPLCDERRGTDNEEERRELKPGKRILAWVIDRDHEDRGPQLWSMPWSMDRDLGQQACDERTGEVLYIDDPDEGYDIAFTKEGTGKTKTKYVGLKILHRPSELSKEDEDVDEWLGYIEDHPLPECLNVFDGKYIEKIFAGGGSSADDEDETDEEEEETVAEEEPEEKPRRRRARRQLEEPSDENEPAEDNEEEVDQEEIRSNLRRLRRNRRDED